jgi:hypothetical protein
MIKRECKGCGEMINPKRLEILPKTQFCVSCSDSGRKKAITLQVGEGDHSFTDIVIVEEKDYRKIMSKEPVEVKKKIESYMDFEEQDEKQGFLENFETDSIEGEIV